MKFQLHTLQLHILHKAFDKGFNYWRFQENFSEKLKKY